MSTQHRSSQRKNSGTDSLNYSITQSSRPTTHAGISQSEDQLVDSISRSQMPNFKQNRKKDSDDDEEEQAVG